MNHHGCNNYLIERGGLSFSICKVFVADHEGKDVIPITLAPEHEGETIHGLF